jgi:Ribonuclease G/E
MRRYGLIAIVTLASTFGCRKKSGDTGGTDDSTRTAPPAAAPAPAAPDTSTGVQTYGFDQREQFAQSIRQQLAGLDQQIKGLAAQAKSRGGAVSDRHLANIRTIRKTVDRNLREVEASTAANWDKVKQGVTRSVDNLSEAIEAAQPK